MIVQCKIRVYAQTYVDDTPRLLRPTPSGASAVIIVR